MTGVIRKISSFLWGRRREEVVDDGFLSEDDHGSNMYTITADDQSGSSSVFSTRKSSELSSTECDDNIVERDKTVNVEADDIDRLADDILGEKCSDNCDSSNVDPLPFAECSEIDVECSTTMDHGDTDDTLGEKMFDSETTEADGEVSEDKVTTEFDDVQGTDKKDTEIEENKSDKDPARITPDVVDDTSKDEYKETVLDAENNNMITTDTATVMGSSEVDDESSEEDLFSMSQEFLSVEPDDNAEQKDEAATSTISSIQDHSQLDTKVKFQDSKNKAKKMLRKKIVKSLSNADFDLCEPEICVSVLSLPSVKSLAALKKKIKKGEKVWIQGFLDAKGLDALLDNVDSMSSRRVTNLSDALLLLECVSCIKSVSNSKLGLEALVQDKGNSKRLIKALDTSNIMVKKQVFELLSALCVYSSDGYKLALDALDTFKTMKKQRYRFSVIINELKNAELLPYKTTLMAFINCILVGTEELQERISIRNQFIGLNFLDIVNGLRDEDNDDLDIQCDVFDEERHEDDEEITSIVSTNIDINNPQQLFNGILQKVYNTPQADVFLTVLQSLLHIDPDEFISDSQWNVMEQAAKKCFVLHKAVRNNIVALTDANNNKAIQTDLPFQLATDNYVKETPDATGVLSSVNNSILSDGNVPRLLPNGVPVPPPPPAVPNSHLNIDNGSKNDVPVSPQILNGLSDSSVPPPPPVPHIPNGTSVPIPPPPPPPPMLGGVLSGSIPPPPPPPLILGSTGVPMPPSPPGLPGAPPPPPPPPGLPGSIPPPPPPPGAGPPGAPPPPLITKGFAPRFQMPASNLKGINTPRPKHKMKTFNWAKLSAHVLNENDNIWKDVLKMQDKVKVKYETLEQLFCQKTERVEEKEQTKVKAPTEINLLDTKRSMNVNIFLKQFKSPNKDVVDLVRKGDPSVIGPERLLGLQKIIPEIDEINTVKEFDGDKTKLGNAEKFFLETTTLPFYKTRINGMLMKEEFGTNMDNLHGNLNAMIKACHGLLDNSSLKDFLRYVLHTGNFMNSGGYAGNALGFKIGSLNKLIDTRANKPRVTLLHYITGDAEKEQGQVLLFVDELLPSLSVAAKLTVDNLSSEKTQAWKNLNTLQKEVEKADDDVKTQFIKFLQNGFKELQEAECLLKDIEGLTKKLANHFCESEANFKLEECLNNLKLFCEKVQQCQKENVQRQQQDERAIKRKKDQEELRAKREASGKRNSIPSDNEDCIIDKLLSDIKKGYKLKKASSVKHKASTPVKDNVAV